jgi:hypothetical protein
MEMEVDDAGVAPLQEGHAEVWWQGDRGALSPNGARGIVFIALMGLLIGTCVTGWGAAHVNAGAQRERQSAPGTWLPTWGLALERPFGAVVGHIEAFGVQRSASTFQTGLRWEWTPGWQLDGSIGRQSGVTFLSSGFKYSF